MRVIPAPSFRRICFSVLTIVDEARCSRKAISDAVSPSAISATT